MKWRAIQEDYETETASGRFKVNIMLAVAQDEADRTSERIKAAADYKRAKGEAIGRAPIGYRIREKHFEIDPETEPAVRAFFTAYLTAYRLRDAQAAMLAHGISFNATRVRRTLRNTTYCGDHFGVPCPAYITPEQYDQIRRIVDSRARESNTHNVYLFAGLLSCGLCGARMNSAAPWQKDRIRRIKSYRCGRHAQYPDRCPGTYANEQKLEQYLLDQLAALLDPYRTTVRAERSGPPDPGAGIRRLEGRLARLREMYIEGEIDRGSFDLRREALRAELRQLQAEAAKAAPSSGPLTLPEDWRSAYDGMSEAGKKLFWQKTVSKILIYRDRPPAVQF